MAEKNYPGHISKHGRTWRIELRVNGRKHRFTASSRESAEEKAHEEYVRLKRRYRSGLAEPERMSQVLAGFEEDELPFKNTKGTRTTYRTSLEVFRRFFVEEMGDPLAPDIRARDVKAFIRWRRTHPLKGSGTLSNRTLQRERTVLHTVFEYARTEELIEGNPVTEKTALESDAREPIILSDDQLTELLEACEDPMMRLYVLLLADTGLRCDSEALWLRWDDIDLSEGFLYVDTARKERNRARTKSGKTRHVPLTPRLREALQAHMATYRMKTYAGERCPWVFHHVRHRRRARPGERIGCLRNGFNYAVRRAKLPTELNQHDLRHRRVTTWLEEGKPVHLVQRAMGHASIKTTLGYYRFVKEHLRQLVDQPASVEELKEMVK